MTVTNTNTNTRPVVASKPTSPSSPVQGNLGEGLATAEAMRARIAQLEAQLAAKSEPKAQRLYMRVSGKGAASLYGLGRFPVTLYPEQWAALIAHLPEVQAFLKAHEVSLKSKTETEEAWAARTAGDSVAKEARVRAAESEAKRAAR